MSTRSEAQKEADKRYSKKIRGKYKPFIVNLKLEELAYIDEKIKATGMTKADLTIKIEAVGIVFKINLRAVKNKREFVL